MEKIVEGSKVYWHDTAINDYPEDEREEQEETIYQVIFIDEDSQTATIASAHSEAEVYLEELELAE